MFIYFDWKASCKKRPPNFPGTRARFYSLKHNSRVRYEPYFGYKLKFNYPLNKLPDHDLRGVLRCLYGEWVGIPPVVEPSNFIN